MQEMQKTQLWSLGPLVPGRSLRVGNGNPLQYSCLENSMDRGAWRATAHGVARVGHNLATKPTTTKPGLSIWEAVEIRLD